MTFDFSHIDWTVVTAALVGGGTTGVTVWHRVRAKWRELASAEKQKRETAEHEMEKARKHARELAEVAAGLFSPPKIGEADRRASIILLGLGGSGKTSLIKALTNSKDANPIESTEHFAIYRRGFTDAGVVSYAPHGEEHVAGHSPTATWLYLSDYKGQNVGTLVRAFIKEQTTPFSPLKYNYVDGLVLVVDLAEGPAVRPGVKMDADTKRVETHIDEWNDTALDAAFGLLTANRLSFVGLFINKTDVLADASEASLKGVIARFEPLVNRLRQRSQGNVKFELFLGSAAEGTGVSKLQQQLLQSSKAATESK